MSELTQTPTEVYASTNKYMKFAIEENAAAFELVLKRYTMLTQEYDNLPTPEWDQIQFLPIRNAMSDWKDTFFANRAQSGLYPTNVSWGPRRKRQPNGEWLPRATPNQNDSRMYAIIEAQDCSALRMFRLMHDFLSWFSTDAALNSHCSRWADSFSRINVDTVGGHRANNRWGLFNFVHTGPPVGAPIPPIDDFEKELPWSLQGLPDSWWVTIGSYSTIALAFEHLTQRVSFAEYSKLARDLNRGVWNARLNQSLFLMPSTVTPAGVLPGDQEEGPRFRYMYDTDCLYWANGLYQTCRLFRSKPVTFLGPPVDTNLPWLSRLMEWRKRIAVQVGSAHTSSFPDLYLCYALGVTIDWILGGWMAKEKQFRRKIFHDGTGAGNELYGDGKYNTLEMLVWAYLFTADILFLNLFVDAWDKMMELVTPPAAPSELLPPLPPNVKPFFHGVMPYSILGGKLADPWFTDPAQDIFLNLAVRAYRASEMVGSPNAGLLTKAETLADRLIELASEGNGPYVLKRSNGVGGSAFMALARARGKLHRIAMNMSSPGQTLTITPVGVPPLVVNVPALKSRAVIYMDEGDYTVSSSAGGSIIISVAAADTEFSIF
jgi:hypothetical protein